MTKILAAIAVVLCLAAPAIASDAGPSDALISVSFDAAPVAPAPSAAAPNPIEHPAQAWTEAKAARKVGWPIAIFLVLVMLSKAVAYGREKFKTWPVIGKAAQWLSVGKRAMIVAGVGAVSAAGYDVLASGGSLVGALVAAGMAFAGWLHSTTKGA
jgi:hypothetical protein